MPEPESTAPLPPGLSEKARLKITKELDRNGAWETISADIQPAVIITLVHGTWGTRSELANDGSRFCEKLRDELDEPAHFSIFRWSGDNTHAARIAASLKLRHYIAEVRGLLPAARHYLICHSHAGNIAFYALREDLAASAVTGLITLSTPFIHARQRPVNWFVRSRLDSEHSDYCMGIAFLLLSISLISEIVFDAGQSILHPLIGLFCGIFILIGSLRRRPLVSATFSDRASFEEAVSLPTQLAPEVLILRTSADEASGILSIGSMTAWASMRILTPLIVFIRRFYVNGWLILALSGAMMIGLLVNMVAHYGPWADQATGHWLMTIGTGGRLLLALGSGLMGLLKTIPLLVAIICWLMARPYGAGIGLRTATNLELTAESAPPGGPWPIYNVLPPRRRHFSDGPGDDLMHSGVYRSQAAIAIMALWIKAGRGASEQFVASRPAIDRLARIFRS